MSEFSAQFGNQMNGYKKTDVDLFLKGLEEKLQERAATIDALQQQVAAMQEQLEKAVTPEVMAAADKIELYDKLMKKMDGDYNNLLAPAIAKAKAIEARAERDYELRMDQARATADGIYEQAAGKIAEVVDQNMDRMYGLLNDFIYSKSLPGRVEAFFRACNIVSGKIAAGVVAAAKVPGKAYNAAAVTVKKGVVTVQKGVAAVQTGVANVKGQVKEKIDTYKQNKAAAAEAVAEVEAE